MYIVHRIKFILAFIVMYIHVLTSSCSEWVVHRSDGSSTSGGAAPSGCSCSLASGIAQSLSFIVIYMLDFSRMFLSTDKYSNRCPLNSGRTWWYHSTFLCWCIGVVCVAHTRSGAIGPVSAAERRSVNVYRICVRLFEFEYNNLLISLCLIPSSILLWISTDISLLSIWVSIGWLNCYIEQPKGCIRLLKCASLLNPHVQMKTIYKWTMQIRLIGVTDLILIGGRMES